MNYYAEKLSTCRLRRCYEIAPPRIVQMLRAEIEFVAASLSTGYSVLELGCGYGRVAGRLCGDGRRVVGIDISEDNVALARELHRGCAGIEFHTMDAVRMDFPDGLFDVTVCIQNGISSFRVEPHALIAEALRVTKPSGRVLFSSYSDKIWEPRLEWFQMQADEGLLGEIDYEQTRDGVIVCRDGFRATTFSAEDFLTLAADFDAAATICEVDNSTLFCQLVKR